jgi:hypothetical protein
MFYQPTRTAPAFTLYLVWVDVPITEVAHKMPFVLGLTIHYAATLDSDVDQIFAVEEGALIEAGWLFAGIDGRSGLDMDADMAAQVNRSCGVITGREIDYTPASGRASLNGLLDSSLGIFLFFSVGAEMPHVVHEHTFWLLGYLSDHDAFPLESYGNGAL